MKRKIMTMFMCPVLIAAIMLPCTLAVSNDIDSAEALFTMEGDTASALEESTPENIQPEVSNTVEETASSEVVESSAVQVEPLSTEGEADSSETCTCGTETHTAECALYAADALTTESEIPGANEGAVEKLLLTTTEEEFFTLFDALTPEQFVALTDEQSMKITAHLNSIEPEAEPEVIFEECEPAVESELYTPTKNYTYVAPLGDPVTGK